MAAVANWLVRRAERPQDIQERNTVQLSATIAKIVFVVTGLISAVYCGSAILAGKSFTALFYALSTALCYDNFRVSENIEDLATKPAEYHGCIAILKNPAQDRTILRSQYTFIRDRVLKNTILYAPALDIAIQN